MDAAKIGLALQRVIRGENLEDIDPDLAHRYMAFMAALDVDADAYEKNKERFILDARSKANYPTEKRKAELNERTEKKFKSMRAQAVKRSSDKKKWMTEQVQKGPKVQLYVEPKVVTGINQGNPAVALEGYKISLNGVSVYLRPGMNEVHPLIADRYQQIMRSRQETAQRKNVLQSSFKGMDSWSQGMPDGWAVVAKEMNRINSEFDSTSGSGEAGKDWTTPDLRGGF